MATPRTQPCSTMDCLNAAAFTTRSAPAYCVQCIDAFYRRGGLEPIEPFTARKARRLTECTACRVRLTYPLEYVMEKNGYGEPVCRVCFWRAWGAEQRRRTKTQLDMLIGASLARATDLSAEEKAFIAAHEDARHSIDRWWWPTERTRAAVDLLHHDLVLDTAHNNDGMDPVVVRCRQCGFESVELPGRMGSELAGRWCMCPSCNARNKGSCASDVAVGFAARGLAITEPRQGPDTVQDAHCARCGTPRRVAMRQLNRGLVPCYVCDGAADPSSPHRVYLFHFPAWHAFKVGITNSGNDLRLQTHCYNGGQLVEIVTVPHRGAALWMEAEVLSGVGPWPATGEPVQQRITGWTEMWDESAPITIRLADYLPRAEAIPLDPVLVGDWMADRTALAKLDLAADWGLRPGDRVCFTGSGPGRTRSEWQQFARDAGLHPVGNVTAGVALLIVPDSSWVTSKRARAVQFDVPVATYTDLLGAASMRLPPS